MGSHGAVFAAAKVDPLLCQMRVTRMVDAFAAGRIINPGYTEGLLPGGVIESLSLAVQEEA